LYETLIDGAAARLVHCKKAQWSSTEGVAQLTFELSSSSVTCGFFSFGQGGYSKAKVAWQ
jgi:hypothetical protein